MPTEIEVTRVLGNREAIDALRRAKRVVGDLRPYWRQIDKHVSSLFRRQFATQGAMLTTPWRPLQDSTLRARQRPGHGRGGILRDTNRLWGPLTKGRGPEAIRSIERLRYERGTSVPYAIYHQFGVYDQSGTLIMPQRKIIPDAFPASVERVWLRLLARRVESVV